MIGHHRSMTQTGDWGDSTAGFSPPEPPKSPAEPQKADAPEHGGDATGSKVTGRDGGFRALEPLLGRLVLIVAVTTAVGCALAFTGLSRFADQPFGDQLTRWRPDGRIPSELALVAINVKPPTRGEDAVALRNLHQAGARLIALDLTLTHPCRKSAKRPCSPGGDQAVLRAMKQASPIVLAVQEGEVLPPGYVQPTTFVPPSRLDRAGVRFGTGAYTRDWDGVIRRVTASPLRVAGSDGSDAARVDQFPSFAYAVAMAAGQGDLPEGLSPEKDDLIDFRGGNNRFPTIAFADLLAGRFPAGTFRDKVVIVGGTRTVELPGPGPDGIAPPTPFGAMDQVVLDANAVATLLDGAPLRSPTRWTVVLIVLVAAFMPVIALGSWPPSRTKLLLGVPPLAVAVVLGGGPRYDEWMLWPWCSAATTLVISSIAVIALHRSHRRRAGLQ